MDYFGLFLYVILMLLNRFNKEFLRQINGRNFNITGKRKTRTITLIIVLT